MTNKSKTHSQKPVGPDTIGIYSNVHGRVNVCPKTAQLTIELEIEATNETKRNIGLVKPYYLPRISGVRRLEAKDDKGDLKTFHHASGRNGVRFRKGSRLDRGKKYKWIVSFKCPGTFRRYENSIAGPYPVSAQHRFNGVDVTVHDFEYEFFFPKLPPKRWWPFRSVDVIEVNDKKANCSIHKGFLGTRCILLFSLKKGQRLSLFLASRYGFSSRIKLFWAIVITAVVSTLGPGFLKAAIDRFVPWWLSHGG